MAEFVRLTTATGHTTYVNPAHVAFLYEDSAAEKPTTLMRVTIDGNLWHIRGALQEVIDKLEGMHQGSVLV